MSPKIWLTNITNNNQKAFHLKIFLNFQIKSKTVCRYKATNIHTRCHRGGVISLHPHPCIAALLIFSPEGYFVRTKPKYKLFTGRHVSLKVRCSPFQRMSDIPIIPPKLFCSRGLMRYWPHCHSSCLSLNGLYFMEVKKC